MNIHALRPQIEKYYPDLLTEIVELQNLSSRVGSPVVTAFGKYNVGKSSLLNTLIGSPIFAVADKRQTTENQCHEANEICWLDTPGLDADTSSNDDKHAHEALQKAVSNYLDERGLKEGSHWRNPHEHGRTLFEVGFAWAICKVLGG